MSLLTRKTVVLAKLEDTYGTDPVPTAAANAIMCNNVVVKPTGEVVERNYYMDTLSKNPFRRGIKSCEVTFQCEFKGTGAVGVRPAWGWEGDLLQACGLKETITSTGVSTSPTLARGSDATAVASASFDYFIAGVSYNKTAVAAGTALSAGTIPQNKWAIYLLSINAAGTITVTPGSGNGTGYSTESAALAGTPATPSSSVAMGTVTVKSTDLGGFVAGTTTLNDAAVTCHFNSDATQTAGIVYKPTSVTTEQKSITLYVYRDGIFHPVTGCRGTVKFTLEVGKLIVADFKFNGVYDSPSDVTASATTFSTVDPETVINANFTIGAFTPVAEKLELDVNNTLVQRKDLNAPSGLIGYEITDRTPQGSLDPEATLEATHPFWNEWETAETMALNIGPIGSTAGNKITFAAPKMQFQDLTYADKSGLMTYSIPYRLAMNTGDDEFSITIS
jgi:hypothetical protein